MDERARVDCVANARALAPKIAAAAPHIEANRELPADLVDALHEARLYRMLVPRSYGGEEDRRLRPGHRGNRQIRRLHGVVHRADFGVLRPFPRQ